MRKQVIGLTILVLICSILLAGCTTSSASSSTGLPPSESPKDYFPTTPGTEWHYKIVATAIPLSHGMITWPTDNGRAILQSSRGILLSKVVVDKTYNLEYKVKGYSQKQGPLQVSDGVEIELLQDELGIFGSNHDIDGIFWAPFQNEDGGQYLMNQVITYSPTSIASPTNSWDGWGQEDGYSIRAIYFGERPGSGMSRENDKGDVLIFVGVDTNVPGYQGLNCLHFTRQVSAKEISGGENPDYLDKGFAEDTWFAKDKGLVRFEQKIDGQTSMVWTLEKFIPGR